MTLYENEVTVNGSAYDAVRRAYEMCAEALEVVCMDGPGEVTSKQLAAMARIVLRSARTIFEDGGPHPIGRFEAPR